ncbi:MAG: aminotransferase class I/II-fold pyridoxal phosphate-dependent enzyme [Candidatus Schekmanbacteria bacterium]|nr:aminotransferase class I/II-fold pyridoxal phosphate-dependent enzyme [Candidatus Schekmanbacteria bacterium]
MSNVVADFRSDTVTRPTPAMRRAMAEAPVGDDVFSDDPTVNELQNRVAALFDKEAALFFPSGTMANQTALRCHTVPGDEVLVEADAHLVHYELAGAAVHSGAQLRYVPSARGIVEAATVAELIRPTSPFLPPTRLIWLENTHNEGGGTVIPISALHEVKALAERSSLRLHLDGARIWNAAAASGVSFRDYGNACDSLMVSLSKGLCCPVGSLLVGDAAFISRARRERKRFGGGMRQVGVLAACGLVALAETLPRLAEDHRVARRLAEGLAEISGIDLDLDTVQTNIVRAHLSHPRGSTEALADALRDRGFLMLPLGHRKLRFVTHRDVSAAAADGLVQAIRDVIGSW